MKNILVRKQESRPFPSAESPHGNRPWAIWKPTRRCRTLATIFPGGQPSRRHFPIASDASEGAASPPPPGAAAAPPPRPGAATPPSLHPRRWLLLRHPSAARPPRRCNRSASSWICSSASSSASGRRRSAPPPPRPGYATPSYRCVVRLPQLPVPHLPVQDPAPRYSPSSPPSPVRLMVAEPWCTIPPAAAPGSGCAVATHCTVKWLVIFGHNLQSNLIFVI